MKSIAKRALLILIAWCAVVLVVLIALEISLRVFTEPAVTPGYNISHPDRRYVLRPGFKGWTYGKRVEVNSMGLREPESPISTGDEAYRVIVLGDSVTFGRGVDLEETFPKILERKLNRQAGKPVHIYNLGVESYNTVAEFRYLKDVFDRLKPHLVIFEFTAGNDTILTELGLSVNQFAPIRWIKDILRHLYSYDWLASKFYSIIYRFYMPAQATGDSDQQLIQRLSWDNALFDESFKGWQECKRAFEDIAQFGRAKSVPIIFALQVNNIKLTTKEKDDPWYPVVRKLREALAEAGIEKVVLIDEAFRSYAGREQKLWIRPQDSHFSVLAHELTAELLYEKMTSFGWWPPKQ